MKLLAHRVNFRPPTHTLSPCHPLGTAPINMAEFCRISSPAGVIMYLAPCLQQITLKTELWRQRPNTFARPSGCCYCCCYGTKLFMDANWSGRFSLSLRDPVSVYLSCMWGGEKKRGGNGESTPGELKSDLKYTDQFADNSVNFHRIV